MAGSTVENVKYVTAFNSIDLNDGAVTGDYVSLKNYDHLTIVLDFGVIGAATTFTVNKATAVDGTGATAIGFHYWKNAATGTSDTLVEQTKASASGVATSTANNQMFVIEIDAAELGAYDCVNVNLTDPGAETLASGLYILSGGRFKQATPPTAITD